MPNYTGNLNLAKPIPMEDAADIQVINENMDKIDTWSMDIDEKTKAATSEIPGIVKYGTEAATALEGSKLAEILGIEYGGVLNNNNQKVAGKGYYDTANKKIYKCTANTSINYADAGYFIEVSNNDLLGKLQNLAYIETIRAIPIVSIGNLDIRAYIFNNMVFISSYLDTGSLSINGITNNGLDIAKLEFNKKFVGVMSPIINNTNGFQGNVRLLSDGRILLESNISNVPPLTRMGFVIVTSIFS